MQMTVVGVLMGYITLVSALRHFDSEMLDFVLFDYQYYFNILLWATAAITSNPYMTSGSCSGSFSSSASNAN